MPAQRGRTALLAGSAWVVVAIAIQAVLTWLIWFLAARLEESATVGSAAALYASLQFVNYATGMGLTVTLARFGAGTGRDADAWFGWSILYTIAASAAGTAAYFALFRSHGLEALGTAAIGATAFFTLSAGASIGLLVDVRLIAARRWMWLVAKNALIGMLRFPLLAVHPFHDRAVWLFAVISGPQAVVGVVGVLVLPAAMSGYVRFHVPAVWRKALAFSAVNWIALLANQAPLFAVPIIVAFSVSSSVNATFYVAWSISATLFVVPGAISQVALVEGARDARDYRARARRALWFAAGISVAAVAGSCLLAPFVTTLYGHSYRFTADILPFLVAANIPWSFAAMGLAEARLRHDHVTTVGVTLVLGGGTVGATLAAVPFWGVKGAVAAWLAGNTVAALVGTGLRRRRWSGPLEGTSAGQVPVHPTRAGETGAGGG